MPKRREVYSVPTPWETYALGWAQGAGTDRLAVGSFVESEANEIAVIAYHAPSDSYRPVARAPHAFPANKLQWGPPTGPLSEFVASSSDFLRLYKVSPTPNVAADQAPSSLPQAADTSSALPFHFEARTKFINNRQKNQNVAAPCTSFDWNYKSPELIVSSSVDTTCCVWDVVKETTRTQLIAHDSEVYDVAWRPDCTNIFATCGADGSLRTFDLRSLDSCTVVYENAKDPLKPGVAGAPMPMLRLGWNQKDDNIVACFSLEGTSAFLLDIRNPSVAIGEVRGHTAPINTLTWAPHSGYHLATGADDNQVLIWDIGQLSSATTADTVVVTVPKLHHVSERAVSQVAWSSTDNTFMATSGDHLVTVLRV